MMSQWPRLAFCTRCRTSFSQSCRHSRVGALLSGINVILVQTGIYQPVTNGIMDTRLHGYDAWQVFDSP